MDTTTGAVTTSTSRRLGLVAGGSALLEAIVAVFLLLMASLTVEATGRSLVAGGLAAGVGALGVLATWRTARTARPGTVTSAAWVCRLLPVVATAAAVVPASVGWLSWLAVPLVLFASAPAAVVGVVLPALARDAVRAS